MTDFRDAVIVASDEGYSMTDEGLAEMFECFEHLSRGGSIYDHPTKPSFEFNVLLAVAWKDCRDYALMRERYGNRGNTEEG